MSEPVLISNLESLGGPFHMMGEGTSVRELKCENSTPGTEILNGSNSPQTPLQHTEREPSTLYNHDSHRERPREARFDPSPLTAFTSGRPNAHFHGPETEKEEEEKQNRKRPKLSHVLRKLPPACAISQLPPASSREDFFQDEESGPGPFFLSSSEAVTTHCGEMTAQPAPLDNSGIHSGPSLLMASLSTVPSTSCHYGGAPKCSPLESSAVDCGQWSYAAENSRASRVTGLYAELVKELEIQLVELKQRLRSQDEAALRYVKRIRELEGENRQLKLQLRSLEEQNDLLSIRNNQARGRDGRNVTLGVGNKSIEITDSNIQFIKELAGVLETNIDTQDGNLPLEMVSPSGTSGPASFAVEAEMSSPARRPSSGGGSALSPWISLESSGSPAALSDSQLNWSWEESVQNMMLEGSPVWASSVEENGRPKLELIPGSGVFITQQQLDDLSQISTDKPKLMTRRLLDYFFSRETLARSSATGQRIAHNNTTMEKPIRLPVAVVNAIKEYVTKVCGRGCNFNAVINSKCGTSRRAVKRMTVKVN
ncbi:uncharacterized protein LOC102361767 [Latimeria chalumnae]|uniref:uncharacterized protein LOC102361767 n=1 Tax=Latimeria chalumnae TaxID=7897 RepID=UPI0003C1B212|nr:PREDICTED: uncharacterized protein LOC102361767 [Latimeria chalumnae]|eukprot:XP_005990087.1 PREDICTED: uncharacterized protein LOC102361767 [Latimeria chalumnae]